MHRYFCLWILVLVVGFVAYWDPNSGFLGFSFPLGKWGSELSGVTWEEVGHVLRRSDRYISREVGLIVLWRGIKAYECVKDLLYSEEKWDQTGSHDIHLFSVSRLPTYDWKGAPLKGGQRSNKDWSWNSWFGYVVRSRKDMVHTGFRDMRFWGKNLPNIGKIR